MSLQHLSVAIMCLTVAIDNGLLAGILMPDVPKNIKRDTTLVVGPLLALIQFELILAAQKLLVVPVIQFSAIALLTWITIQTILDMAAYRNTPGRFRVFLRVLVCTAVANVDDILWVGAKVGEQTRPLLGWSLGLVPITIVFALFLAEQCQRHRWILLFGAALTAWSASEIFMKTTVGIATGLLVTQSTSPWATQFLLTSLLLLTGLSALRIRSKARG